MLKLINFRNDDMRYILCDVLDRGPNPIKIILDLMQRVHGYRSKNEVDKEVLL